ncbi:MAG TPA: LysR family transcriptional regulator [Modicisalibacter sp.]|nr:LysR family transcriptional regulator [Modicisalibacter sp.]
MSNDQKLFSTNWDDIKYFLMLKRQLRLTLTAKALGTSHVTVANRIASLEKSLGTQLFIQDGQGYKLTKSGSNFSQYAEELERHLILALESTERGNLARSKVRIGVTEGLGDNFLSSRIAKWMINEELEVDFISLPKSTSVTSREADISITLEKPVGEFVIRRILSDYTLGIYASHEYMNHHGPIDEREKLIKHTWIGYIESMMFTEELKYHYEISSNLDFIFNSTSIRAQQQAARAGLGLSILPDYMAKNDSCLVRVLPEIQFMRHYWISTNRDLHRFQAVNLAWDFILECCRCDRDLLHHRSAASRD